MVLCLQRYDYIPHYCPGKEMLLPDTLSHFKAKSGPEIALDIAIHHAHLSPVCRKSSNWLLRQMLRCVPLLTSSSLAGPMKSRKFHIHYVPTSNTVKLSLLKIDLCSMEKPSSSLHQKGVRSLVHCTSHTKASPKHSYMPMVASSGLV